MAESDDARATARRHTARLLRMLRGQGPPPDPAASTPLDPGAAVESRPDRVAEAPMAYEGRLDPVLDRPSREGISADAEAPTPSRQRLTGAVASIGETLYRQKGALGELMARAEHRVRLSRIFHAYLVPPLRDHAVLIRLDEEEWLVHTDSAGWATRLRYALYSIRDPLGQHLGIPLPKPRIRVVPVEAPPSRAPRPPLRLTERNARLLKVTAHNLSDERLSAALLRLAEHTAPAENAGR